MNKTIEKYKDIIDLPHHEPKNFPRMSMYERAAQFSAFDAVTGHSEAIEEQSRFVENYLEISEEDQRVFNIKLREILAKIKDKPVISVKYFVPDKVKDGGEYLTYIGVLKRFDEVEKRIEFIDGTKIALEQIFDINEIKE